MPVAFAEAHDLVLDRWAIARPAARDLAGIHRRAVNIVADDPVRRLGGAGDAALDLGLLDALGQRRERLRRLVAGLHLDRGPVDGAAVEPRRRAGLEATERKPDPLQRERQTDRRRLADAAGRRLALADMDQAAQERSGGENDGPCPELAPVRERETGDPAIADDQIVGLGLDHREIGGAGDRPLHRRGVELAIGLGARPAHRRALAAVEHAELDAAAIGHAPHQPIERVDLAHQMALAEPADRGIAGHGADGREPMGDQRDLRAHARRRRRRLAAGVPAAHDDHVVSRIHRSALRDRAST